MLHTLAFFTVLHATSIPLPGGPPVGMDYLAYDAAHHRVWVPAGNTGNVDVVDTATEKVSSIGGFVTAPARRPGRPHMGPSSATVGDGVVWIGNRGDSSVCAFDAVTLAKRGCARLASMPDGIAYVAARHEVWVTTPAAQAITVVDVHGATPTVVAQIAVGGGPEGYAVDDTRGVFYTNLEDKDSTVVIDVRTRKLKATWPTGCGGDGPRGLALDAKRAVLMVACTDGALTLDVAHAGRRIDRLKTQLGVDNIDYDAARQRLYVASREDGVLTIARVEGGKLTPEATVTTTKGARNAVVDTDGTAYLADSNGGQLIVVKASATK